MDQYTVQSSGVSLQKDPPGPLEKGADPTGAQILAAIESSRQAMQTQIAAIAVDVNLLRADLRVVEERSVATEKQVTCLQSEMDTLKASVAILEAKTRKLGARVQDAEDWLEQNDVAGTPEFLVGESGRRPQGTAEVHPAAGRSTRRGRAGQGSRVIVSSDATLCLEHRRREREKTKLLVQTVTSEASSHSGSPCVAGRLSLDLSPVGT
ncbi:hypothetical protein NDU88_003784 [Pleurodeles waltl]|uniref:Uncharacterized protein n=1 Tax=Pleurodeles waltl TaxID=8319 RepID=A0AAV7T696_PLEWA|nr:hypothetical protein NDU88_003784 [Pleurodeles waltl]